MKKFRRWTRLGSVWCDDNDVANDGKKRLFFKHFLWMKTYSGSGVVCIGPPGIHSEKNVFFALKMLFASKKRCQK